MKFWQLSDEQSTQQVDHSLWQDLLTKYVKTGTASGINLISYASVTQDDKRKLSKYINKLAVLNPRTLSRKEQFVYWINLYNALTVNLVLKHYPLESIKQIKQRWYTVGPWGDDIVTIEGQTLTLNNIEHGILRPIWQDPRIHYAVNCASLGCPNIQPIAFTAQNSEELLEKAAREFINHQRAVLFKGNILWLSEIYRWYESDYGENKSQIISHLLKYANEPLKNRLRTYKGKVRYHYDWQLNKLDKEN